MIVNYISSELPRHRHSHRVVKGHGTEAATAQACHAQPSSSTETTYRVWYAEEEIAILFHDMTVVQDIVRDLESRLQPYLYIPRSRF